jgi:hypothetical protein
LVIGICQNQQALSNITTRLITGTDPSYRLGPAIDEPSDSGIAKAEIPQIGEELLGTPALEQYGIHAPVLFAAYSAAPATIRMSATLATSIPLVAEASCCALRRCRRVLCSSLVVAEDPRQA